MDIAIIDADLVGRKKHRFPNLACMKLSSYYKRSHANKVVLKTDYGNLENFDMVFISKVFTDTPVDNMVLQLPNVKYGGSGFFYDKSPPLQHQIEHSRPDYHLYDDWVQDRISHGASKREMKYYTDYSIGFLTRGCFRQCQFCVNRNFKQVCVHSPLEEFYDSSRSKICLLDDNFLGFPQWEKCLKELQATGKPFQFKQGLDERLLDDEKCKVLFESKYDSDYIFAFDNIADADLIEKKLSMIRRYTNKCLKFYTFCGFDRTNTWDNQFWRKDLLDLFKRIEILFSYHAAPYIMRYARYVDSPYANLYVQVARWCNQPAFLKKKSFHEFVKIREGGIGWNAMLKAEHDIPELSYYFQMKW